MDRSTTVLYVATSVDGYVATADGGVDWLDGFQSDEVSEGYDAFFDDVDCLVMGSTTYEQVLGFGEWPYDGRPTYVVTSRDLPRAADTVEFVSGGVDELAERLERRGDRIWLVGGAQLAQAFLREGHVDRLRLAVVPILLGGGISLFGDGPRQALTLVETTEYANGLVELAYEIDTE
ncbi:dihydrofolate reductase family protein [Halomicroarcula sp. S1AR25-4]|uniref:dihydrofolate reductase family protein n=1 Tax=Haloarcula sp. S1AR25-4 TaxID=2950538 RepID=UPI0028765333|nr:dihydrofolate reductase family protein [Halomicroarcula sp. S1AR25-4]MDS0278087.1 dihydrofolate reductase family protein [Halomicroarcula sp. S1AR25-4]